MTMDNFLGTDPSNGATIVSNDAFAALQSSGALGTDAQNGFGDSPSNSANPVGSGGFDFGGFLGSAANALGGAGNLALGYGQNYLVAQQLAARTQQITQILLIGGAVVAVIFLLRKKG